MITTNQIINFKKQLVPPCIPAVQGDTGRSIVFELTDYTIPEGSTATYYVAKPSGLAVYNTATIANNKVTVDLTAQSLAEIGENFGQVRISKNDVVITSFDFVLLVQPFRGIDAIESTTETNIFDQAVADAEDAIEAAAEEAVEYISENIDDTLSIAGKAADAKATGDAIADVVEDVTALQTELPDLTEAVMSAYVTDTASGAIATFPDGADGIPVKSLSVDVEPVQDLHGYDNPWPAGGNVNLFDGIFEQGTINGNSGMDEQDTSKVRTKNYIPLTPGQAYYYQKKTSDYGFYIYCYDSSKNLNRMVDGSGIGTTFTAGENDYYMRARFNTGTVANMEGQEMMVSKGTTRQTWSPYSNICPITGWTGANVVVSPTTDAQDGTTYTIDWTTEAGTVYGGTLDVVTGVLTVTDANIASYNGETLPGEWISDRDVYAEGTTPTTGAQVVYNLATPQTVQLTAEEVTTLLGTNNIFADCGDVSCEYRADTKLYIDKLLNA